MNLLHLPWLELAFAVTLLGSLCVSHVRNPDRVYRWSVVLIGGSFGCTVLAWLAFYVGVPPESLSRLSIQPTLFGRQIFLLDELSAPIVPAVVLLHLLTALSTSRTFMRRYRSRGRWRRKRSTWRPSVARNRGF